jgi:hypothetical protein
MAKTFDVKNAQADHSFSVFHPNESGAPADRPEMDPDAKGQHVWSSLKQRQKGEPLQKTYTADEVESIVKHAVAEALKMVNKPEKHKEKKEPAEEIKIGGK